MRSFTGQGEQLSHYLKEVKTCLHAAIPHTARLDPPVAAAVHGAAAEARLSSPALSDLVVTAESARFIVAYTTKAGPMPDGYSKYYLRRLVGLKRAMDLTLANRQLSAQEAMR